MASTGLTGADGANPDTAVSPGRASVFTVGTQDGAPSPGRTSDFGAQQAGQGVATTVATPSTGAAGAALPDPAVLVNADASVTRQISGESEADLLEQHLLQPDLSAALEAYMRSLRDPPQWNTWQNAFYFFARNFTDSMPVEN